jgi:hypothetical protein
VGPVENARGKGCGRGSERGNSRAGNMDPFGRKHDPRLVNYRVFEHFTPVPLAARLAEVNPWNGVDGPATY